MSSSTWMKETVTLDRRDGGREEGRERNKGERVGTNSLITQIVFTLYIFVYQHARTRAE